MINFLRINEGDMNMSRIIWLIGISIITFYCNGQNKYYPNGMDYEHYLCFKTNSAIEIDGKGDEQPWLDASWTEDFVDIEGELKDLPSLRTRAKMLWDNNYFYVFAELVEPHVWGSLTEADAVIFNDDDFEIFIDPDGDGVNYYELEVNVLETLWDLILLRAYRADDRPKVLNNWNLRDIQVAVHINGTINNPSDVDQGWTVEWAIPFTALDELADFQRRPKDGDHWKVDFSRVDWDMEVKNGEYSKVIDANTGKRLPEHNWVWNPTGLINMHMPEMWGTVQFSDKIPGSKNIEYADDKDAALKKQLWTLYRIQLERKNQGLDYISSKKDLCKALQEKTVIGNFKIYTTPNYFEIIAAKGVTGDSWAINSLGRLYLSD